MEELKSRRDVVDRIDWEMTPEKAVETFLEWGTSWTRRDDFVRSAGDEAIYFVIYDWEKPPQVTLLRRSMRDDEELAKIQVPEELAIRALAEAGRKPGVGVYALNEELKDWLKEGLGC